MKEKRNVMLLKELLIELTKLLEEKYSLLNSNDRNNQSILYLYIESKIVEIEFFKMKNIYQ